LLFCPKWDSLLSCEGQSELNRNQETGTEFNNRFLSFLFSGTYIGLRSGYMPILIGMKHANLKVLKGAGIK